MFGKAKKVTLTETSGKNQDYWEHTHLEWIFAMD